MLGGGGVEDKTRGGPDVDPGAVAFDEGNDRLGRDDEDTVVPHCDALCHAGEPTGKKEPFTKRLSPSRPGV